MSDIEAMEDAPLPDEVDHTATSQTERETPKDEANKADDADPTKDEKDASTEAPDEPEESDDAPDENAEPKETKSQRKRRMRREREQERERELTRSKERIAQLEQELAEAKAPEYSQYDNPDDYVADRAAWKARQQNLEDQKKAAQGELTSAEEQAQADGAQAMQELLDEGREAHADFEDVVRNPTLPIAEGMLQAAIEADNSSEVMYFLGKNPDEARRIAGLSPVGQAVEIGKLAHRLATPRKKPSSAPPPVKPVRGASGKFEKNPEDMTPEEYKKWRLGE